MSDETAIIIALFAREGWTVTIEPLAETDYQHSHYRAIFSRQNEVQSYADATSLCGFGNTVDDAVTDARARAVEFINLWPDWMR